MSGFFFTRSGKMQHLRRLIPASRHVWWGYQWECDPHPPTAVLPSIPSPCREAAVSALCPSGQLLTWCTASRTSTDESLIPGSNCRADTRFPECQRGPAGDRHGVWASLILVECGWALTYTFTHHLPCLSADTLTKTHAYRCQFHAFLCPCAPARSIYSPQHERDPVLKRRATKLLSIAESLAHSCTDP